MLVIGGMISYRALFQWTRPASFVASLMIMPIMQLLFFVLVGRAIGVADDNFYVLGLALLGATGACIMGGTMAIANERIYGTLGPVLLSTCRRGVLWASRAVPYVVNAFAVMVFTLVCASLLLGLRIPVGALLPALVAMAAGSFSCTAFGIGIGALGLRFRNVNDVANLALMVFVLTSGAVVPRQAMPEWINGVGAFLPLTHAIRAARGAFAGQGWGTFGGEILAETAVGIGYCVLALVMLRLFEARSRNGLSLDAA
jgi:ABC-2 type transport system permease protein